jgi:chromosome segregation ATPase
MAALSGIALENEHHGSLRSVYDNNFMSQYKILNDHPEYFQQQCNEFELFCKKEYEEINNTKEQLKATISLYEDKLSKYTNFEEDKQTLEDELTFCRLDKNRLENETQELEKIKLTLDNEYYELQLEKMELEKEKIRLKEDTMKLHMEQRKIAKSQTSLATIQLSIDDASKALDKEINDLTYAKFIFEREKEEFARATTQEDL